MKLIVMISILISLSTSFLKAGELEDFEDELNKPKQHNNDDDSDEDENEGCFENFLGDIAFEIFIGSEPPIWKYEFQPYIYFDDYSGRYCENGSKTDAEFDFAYLYSSENLTGISLNADFFFARIMSLKGNYQKLSEKLHKGDDAMELFDFFLDYYRARGRNVNWYWGIGLKGLRRNDDYLGFGLNTGCEIYPFKPISLDFTANIGWLNEHPVSRLNTDISFHFWRLKASAGYQKLIAESVEINALSFGLGVNF